MKVSKLKIYQPQAHYRIPFTYQRKHTYPIPPYSTIIGLLCNVLGIRNYRGEGEPCENQNNCSCNYHKLKKIKI
ncbi:MAG: CRISPR-associated protein Cas5, partial [Candidatus Ratteibacteria bacterium]